MITLFNKFLLYKFGWKKCRDCQMFRFVHKGSTFTKGKWQVVWLCARCAEQRYYKAMVGEISATYKNV